MRSDAGSRRPSPPRPKPVPAVLALIGLALALSAQEAGAALAAQPPPRTSEGRLDAAALAPAGKARACLPVRDIEETRPVEPRAVLFRTGANRWFRNDLAGACPGLARERTLVFRAAVGQVCENDIVDVVDPVAGQAFGFCRLGPFTPVVIPRGSRF